MATLSELRTRVRERADMELGSGQSDTDHFITNAELNRYINASVKRLYNKLVKADGDYYTTTNSPAVTGGSFTLALPNDFFKIKSLERQVSTDKYVDVPKFNFKERNKSWQSYRVVGSSIRMSQPLQSGDVYRIWYVPKHTDLSADGDTFDGINGFEELVVVDSAIKCKQKEESDVSVLMAERAELEREIDEMADDRDLGEQDSIQDVALDYDLMQWRLETGE
jgi:hypothetical protein